MSPQANRLQQGLTMLKLSELSLAPQCPSLAINPRLSKYKLGNVLCFRSAVDSGNCPCMLTSNVSP